MIQPYLPKHRSCDSMVRVTDCHAVSFCFKMVAPILITYCTFLLSTSVICVLCNLAPAIEPYYYIVIIFEYKVRGKEECCIALFFTCQYVCKAGYESLPTHRIDCTVNSRFWLTFTTLVRRYILSYFSRCSDGFY